MREIKAKRILLSVWNAWHAWQVQVFLLTKSKREKIAMPMKTKSILENDKSAAWLLSVYRYKLSQSQFARVKSIPTDDVEYTTRRATSVTSLMDVEKRLHQIMKFQTKSTKSWTKRFLVCFYNALETLFPFSTSPTISIGISIGTVWGTVHAPHAAKGSKSIKSLE